jgi:hypothetical protein
MSQEPVIPTAERTLRLIELLLSRPEGWTPQELLLELDLSRSGLFALLRALKTLGYVDQPDRRGRYTAGPRLNAWRAPQPPTGQDLLSAFFQEAGPTNRRDPQRPPRETLALVLPAENSPQSGFQITAQVESSLQVRSAYITGQVIEHLAAAAQVLTDTPPAEVSAGGYALADDRAAGAIHLALPVCRDGRSPDAALLLSAPAFRWTAEGLRDAFLDELREMAAHLSYRLGAPYYAPYRLEPREGLHSTALLNAEEITAFLRGPYTASLACIRPDGRPHVIPVWQEWDGKQFILIAWQGSQWAAYVEANPHVSLTIDEPWIPLRRVVVSGRAQTQELPPADLERLLARMTRRYLGRPPAPGLVKQVQRAYTICPESMRGWQGLPVQVAAGEPGTKGADRL